MAQTPHVEATDIVTLWGASGPPNAVLAWNGANLVIVARVAARGSHWAIMAYRIDIVETYPGGITLAQAQTEADHINADLARVVAAAKAAAESTTSAMASEDDLRLRSLEYGAQIVLQSDAVGLIVITAPDKTMATLELYEAMLKRTAEGVELSGNVLTFGVPGRGFGRVAYRITPVPGWSVVLLDRINPEVRKAQG